MRRFPISVKLAAGFGIVILLLIMGALFASRGMGDMARRNDRIVRVTTPTQLTAADVRFNLADLYGFQTAYVSSDHAAQRKLFEESLGHLQATLKRLDGQVSTPGERTQLGILNRGVAAFLKLDEQAWKLTQLAGAGTSPEALDITLTQELGPYGQALDAASALRDSATHEQAAATKGFKQAHENASRLLIVIAALSLLIAAAITVLVTRSLVGRMKAILHVAEAIAEGDLDQSVRVGGRDELADTGRAFERDSLRQTAAHAARVATGDLTLEYRAKSERDALGTAFATMTTNLRELVGSVNTVAGSLSSSSQQIAATSDEAGHAVGEIAQAVGDVAQGSEEQVRMVSAARAASDAMAAAVEDSTSNARETSAAAERTREIAERGVDAAGQASEAMLAVRESSASVTVAIETLAAKSERIGGIVTAISGIAEQTNLLALNAAIEAARAGEQGKGFAVVAEEVRKLAEDCQQAAASIEEIVREIAGETSNAVAVVQDGAERTVAGADVVEKARAAFEAIGDSVVDMGDRVQHIAEAVDAIAAHAQDMQASIHSVQEVAERSSASAEQVSASTQETSASAEEIAASAGELATTATELERLVGRFTLAH